MKLIIILIGVVLLGTLINFVRVGAEFPIVQSLPLLGGHPPGLYDLAGCAILAITGWGIVRMLRKFE